MCKKLVFLLGFGLGAILLPATGALAFSYDLRVATGNDDVEEYASAHNMYLDSSDLEIPYESSISAGEEQVIGLRWTVPVPKGAKVLKAYVEIVCDETKSGTGPVNVIVEGQLAPNAAPFGSATADVTGRPTTTAQVKWPIVNWTAAGQKAQSPDISAVIQEIIDQPGWVGGNALVLTIRDDKSNPSNGIRCAEAAESGAGTAPLLHIEVYNPAANTPSPADGAVGVFMPLLSWAKGDDAILHTVYLGKTPDLTQADLVAANQPVTMYYHVPGLDPGLTYYWRVDEADATGKITTGPVWSFVTQAETAYYPAPVNGATDVPVASTLTWQPGLGTLKHHLYFGGSLDDVTKGAAATDKGELTDATFTLTGLDRVATYYWRVDELLAGGGVKTGAVWSFTTHLPVDDFESYTDKEGSEIYSAWIDGFSTGTNGSTVGYLTAANGTFGETRIVHSGKQSMPMDYNNVKTPFYSEAYQEFAPTQDWTATELANLVLDFRGVGTNGAGALYLVVEDSAGKKAVVTHADADAVKKTTWTQWKVPLSSLTGVNLARVKRLYLGVGDRNNPAAGGAGRVYIDDIRVTRP